MIFLAGGFVKFRIISDTLRKLPQKAYRNICVFDGVDNLKWNGGRVNIYNEPFNITKYRYYQARNIGFYVTFSNDVIDVNDPYGNEILGILNTGRNNGVIVANHEFRDYIREKYPNLKICLSITYFDSIEVPENIKELEEKYDYICPRFEMIFNEEFIKVINPKKYKIMLNDTCKYGCKLWKKHFVEIARYNRDGIGDPHKIQECWLPNFNPDIESEYDCMDLDFDAIKRCKEIGYNNFKISGREMKDADFLDELYKYIKLMEII